MALSLIRCACGHLAMLHNNAVNRAKRQGAPVYCSRVCAGIARRLKNPPTAAQRVAAKAAYDTEYRAKNRAILKAKKAAHFAKTYDPEAARVVRAARMPYHVEYCRQPEYRAKKREYDKRLRAERGYGPFADAFMLLTDLQTEVLARASRYEIDLQNGKLNKATKRKRSYVQSIGG